jgi:hypothetical protein
MTGRVLRSRVADSEKDNSDLSAGESTTRLGSREASELGSMGETEATLPPTVNESDFDPSQADRQTIGQKSSETQDLNSVLATIMAAIQQSQENVKKDLANSNENIRKDLANTNESVKKLASSVEDVKKDLAANNENIKKDLANSNENIKTSIEGVKKDLANSIEDVKKDIAANNEKLQESVRFEIENFRKQMKLENEALINRFDNQNKQTKKEFSGKLEAETRRLTNLVSQVQKETESELGGMKRQLQNINSELKEQLQQNNDSTQGIIAELVNHVEEKHSEINNKLQALDKEVNDQIEKQKEGNNQNAIVEKLEVVNAKIVALENKVSETRPAVAIEPLSNENSWPTPSVVHQQNSQATAVQNGESRTCSCQSDNCQECMSYYNQCRVNVGTNQQVSSFLSSTELPLPQFDECKNQNPVSHIRQLDEFMKFRSVPKALQLAVAYRSMTGQMCKQWAETASGTIKDYLGFRREFLKVWWSSSRQSLVKCRLYQGKYNRNSGLSISAYFLQQATIASYLEPKLSDIEIIEAVRFHYPIHVQRAMLSNQMISIGDALDLLKRIEVMEAGENFKQPHYQASQTNQNARRQNPGSQPDNRAQTQNLVRQIQVRSPRRNNHNNRNYRRWNNNQGERQHSLNPNAPTFQSSPQQETRSEN